jgi:cobalt-zinc-cadmium efflux system outer membrane protein
MFRRFAIATALAVTLVPLPQAHGAFTRLAAERAAVDDALVLRALSQEAKAQRAQARATRALPDPQLRLGLANLPADTFAWDQEPMTQLQVSLRQALPNGKARSARFEAAMEGARQTAEQRALAALELRAALRARLIDVAWRQEQGELLARQEAVLAQLEAQALSAFEAGRGTENDVLEARLARQARVQGKLQNDTALASAESSLQRWLPEALLQQGPPPTLKALFPSFGSWPTSAAVREQLETHPAVRRLEAAWKRAGAERAAAKADFGPDYAVDFAYGARDDLSPLGRRPDLLSAGITLSLPLFAREKQEQGLVAAELREEGQRAGLQDALRALKADYDSQRGAAVQQSEALTHYETTLLPLAERHWARSLARFGEGTLPFDRALAAALALLSTQSAALDLNRQRALSESALLFLVAQELDHE